MPRQSIVLDIFLSSPSDLEVERDFVVAISQEWNLLRSRDTGCHLNIITWEDTIAPSLSTRPQQVINEQVGEDYDVYLGMMWSKLGSPTGAAESGTVEEFDRALDRYRRGEGIRLAMLFKTAPIPTRILNGEQFDQVNAFKRRFGEEGGLYKEFETEDELRSVINRLFEQIANGAAGQNKGRSDIRSVEMDVMLESPTQCSEDDLSDIGILDLNEKFSAVVQDQSRFLDGWNAVLASNTEQSSHATAQMEDLTRFGAAEPSALKPIMSNLSNSLDQLSIYVEGNIDTFVEGNNRVIAFTDAMFDLSKDFEDAENEEVIKSSVVDLLSQLLDNKNSQEQLIVTTKGLPRMTTEFNRAKKRAVKALERMLAEIERLRESLSVSLRHSKQGTRLRNNCGDRDYGASAPIHARPLRLPSMRLIRLPRVYTLNSPAFFGGDEGNFP